jgi:hypothetical protein
MFKLQAERVTPGVFIQFFVEAQHTSRIPFEKLHFVNSNDPFVPVDRSIILSLENIGNNKSQT